MAITGYDSLIAALTAGNKRSCVYNKTATTATVAFNWYHLWTVAGMPPAGAAYTGTALAFQRTTESTLGALYHGGNRAALIKNLIATWGVQSVASVMNLMLVDMVGYYPITPSGSAQTMDNTAGPDRYIAAGQSGLQAILVNGALTGASAANIGLTYVNQAGATKTIPTTPAVAVTVSAAAPTAILGSRVLTTVGGPFLPLAAGDTGMRSITDATWSASNTGLHAILMVRPLMTFPYVSIVQTGAEKDLVMQLSNLERVYDGACLSLLAYCPLATGATLTGTIDVVWA